MKYFALSLILFALLFCPISIAQNQYYAPPDSEGPRDIFDCCVAVKFDSDFNVDPYEFAQLFDFLKYDPRLERNYVGFYIFQVRFGWDVHTAMDLIRLEPSVLMVNPIWRVDDCYPYYLIDELIVRFNEDVSVEQRDSILSEFGLVVYATVYPSLAVRFPGRTNKDTWEIGDDLMATGFFIWAFPNYVFQVSIDDMKGDLNYDFKIDIEDLVWLVNNIFYHGLAPIGGGDKLADLNCDLVLGMEDIVRYVNYLFKGQPLLPFD